jgi:hypothetical protein
VSMVAPIGYWSAVGFVLCGFCFVLFRNLLASGYTHLMAFGLSLGSLVQPAYLETNGLRTVLFSFISLTTAWGAAALVQRQEPRRIVLLGSSLAGAQFLNPICGTATMLLLPFALRRALANDGIKHGTGLYISLLFIPALALAYCSITQPEFPFSMALRQKLLAPFPAIALVPLAAAIPVAFAAAQLRSAVRLPLIAVIAALAGVGVFGTVLGFQRPEITIAALAALSVFISSCWPDSPDREQKAMLLIGASLALSWLLALYVGASHA